VCAPSPAGCVPGWAAAEVARPARVAIFSHHCPLWGHGQLLACTSACLRQQRQLRPRARSVGRRRHHVAWYADENPYLCTIWERQCWRIHASIDVDSKAAESPRKAYPPKREKMAFERTIPNWPHGLANDGLHEPAGGDRLARRHRCLKGHARRGIRRRGRHEAAANRDPRRRCGPRAIPVHGGRPVHARLCTLNKAQVGAQQHTRLCCEPCYALAPCVRGCEMRRAACLRIDKVEPS
jgi:hypothetical protein